MNQVYYIMGVSGCGKSTIGQALGDELNIPFYDGDDFHPKANIDKMSSGEPLNDEDRVPWLMAINTFVANELAHRSCVVACSALKESYRTHLIHGLGSNALFIHLDGSMELISARMKSRDHFMPESLLQSQFDILERPKKAITIDVSHSVETIIALIKEKLSMKSEIGLVGLGVMGTSLARNIADKGFRISLYNRRVEGSEEEVAQKAIDRYTELEKAHGFEDLKAFVDSLERPRKIILMITAGKAVDYFIQDIRSLLDEGDILVDGGNTYYKDTTARIQDLAHDGIDWIGTGVSGGQEGALKGPSIMPGGASVSVDRVLPILKKIAAKDQNGNPCCTNVGGGASGHFVKMVHNGIEYAEMQLIVEVYDLLRHANGLPVSAIADLFEKWNQGDLGSYLLEITIDILRKEEGGELLLDQILDVASNKGTGSWTTATAASLGVAVPTLTAALNARYISSDKSSRVTLSSRIQIIDNQEVKVNSVAKAYKVARILNHIQGIQLIVAASNEYQWDVKRSKLLSIWTNGCIIRSRLMEALASISDGEDLFIQMTNEINALKNDLAEVVAQAAKGVVAIPCLMASLAYLQSSARASSAANLIQAQRDYFGAHTYKRSDDPEGPSHHTNWKT